MPGVGVFTTPVTGRLSIFGTSGAYVSLHTYAWDVNPLALWTGGDRRGTDRLLPGTAGVTAYRRRLTVTRYSLPMVVCGDVNRFGTPYGDVWVGMEQNLKYLFDELVADPGTTAGTRAATLSMPSGVDRSANVHVLGITQGRTVEGTNERSGDHGTLMLCTLELSVPSGRFV